MIHDNKLINKLNAQCFDHSLQNEKKKSDLLSNFLMVYQKLTLGAIICSHLLLKWKFVVNYLKPKQIQQQLSACLPISKELPFNKYKQMMTMIMKTLFFMPIMLFMFFF